MNLEIQDIRYLLRYDSVSEALAFQFVSVKEVKFHAPIFYNLDVIAFGHVTLTSVVWQIEYNDTTSPEFQDVKSSVSQMVV